jgi:hypothetical protein
MSRLRSIGPANSALVNDRTRIKVPGVERGLQAVTFGQQRCVLRHQLVYQRIEALPERGGLEVCAGARLVRR